MKQSVHLGQYAAWQGYVLDRKKSTPSSLVMRHVTRGDKIIVSKKGVVWVYFSVHDELDNGTIVDFIKNRTHKTLPEIGRELAAWSGGSGTLPVYKMPDIRQPVYDLGRIRRAFQWMKPTYCHPYLIGERKIPADVLNDPRFAGCIFQDRYGNVVFPHQNGQGVCGLELKNTDKNVFMRGSEKALWLGNGSSADTTFILAEAAIDALSHFALFRPRDAFYGAVSGGMSDHQLSYLTAIIQKLPSLQTIVLAVDHDPGGQKIASRIKSYLAGKCAGTIVRHIPKKEGADWNNVLKGDSN
ncbi:DUF3991 and TOPRIM domain-containing protein [Arsenicibacter rosenii]|uniref:DUF3991 and TOPRIM domain-containing protein n=1 Tax=Arsenicibacter rosenii TaxID=1750698 RepID=UPI001160BA1F|nr:DUF3991 and TOPRIM domain-containing protein [Arsenicibacter rosenii]